MTKLTQEIESLLFVAARPLGAKKLVEITGAAKEEVARALDEIAAAYNDGGRGVRLLRHGQDVQLTTAPEAAKPVREFIKDETTGELTKPSLEALTIIAYRGPITKPVLEQIRGVNCSLILRNLLMRGLIETISEDGETTYRVTTEFIRYLGVSSVSELPDYDKLRSHENIVRVIEMGQPPAQVEAIGEGAAAAGAEVSAEPAATESDPPPSDGATHA